jgi:hypothetical protein
MRFRKLPETWFETRRSQNPRCESSALGVQGSAAAGVLMV